MQRRNSLEEIAHRASPFDMLIVGGGATGVGIAIDAASRGYQVALLEQDDFGKGTSSRSTKLVHGGVRYLQQGNISLVMEALKERGILRANAPHIVHDTAFVVPNYDWWETPFYGVGMKVYDMLAGKYGFGKSRLLSKEEVLERIPTLEQDGLRGGVLYYDGQFDDTRLLVNMAQTADEQGAALLNYARVVEIHKNAEGYVDGVSFVDVESGARHRVAAKVVINATGAWTDALRRLDEPEAGQMIAPSQGVHLVLDRSFLPGNTAIMVPPHERQAGDVRHPLARPRGHRHHRHRARRGAPRAPAPSTKRSTFILETAAPYLEHDPTRADIQSVFAGIRPLVKAEGAGDTAALSRDHTITVSHSGLLSIAGGKWTTYRKMAKDAVDHATTLGQLDERPCVTRHFQLHGYLNHAERFGDLAVYGSDAPGILGLAKAQPELGEPLDPALPVIGAQVVWAARHEMARTVEDVLSRRTRALLLDAAAARRMAPRVAALLAQELGRDRAWEDEQLARFEAVAVGYLPR